MNLSTSSSKRLIACFIAGCASVFALFAGASEWLLRTQVMPEDTLTRHAELFATTRSPYAAFGDSHVARGFNAQTPFVNLAYPSENLDRMAWKAMRYLDRVSAPEKVLIQADAHLFAPYRLNAGLADYPEVFGGKRGALMKTFSSRYRPQLFALWRSFFWNGGRIASRIEFTAQGALLSPGNLADWPESKREKFTRERVELHQPIAEPSRSRQATRYRQMVERFVRAGAEVCLVALPTSSLYRDRIAALSPEKQTAWRDAMAFYQGLAEAPGVRFVDHRTAMSDLSLFRDPDHLNKEGAMQYSPRLQEACFGRSGDERIAAVE